MTTMKLPYSSDTIDHVNEVLFTKLQYSAPLTGASITIGEAAKLLINPAGTIATLTVVFPFGTHGRLLTLVSSQVVTSLTVSGASFTGSTPSALAANTPLRFTYCKNTSTWWSN